MIPEPKGSAPRTSDRKRYEDNWETYLEKRIKRKMKKEKVVIVSGYFDPIRVGHLEYLQIKSQLGDTLLVISNNDEVKKNSKRVNFYE